jgi:hypothetical protein
MIDCSESCRLVDQNEESVQLAASIIYYGLGGESSYTCSVPLLREGPQSRRLKQELKSWSWARSDRHLHLDNLEMNCAMQNTTDSTEFT